MQNATSYRLVRPIARPIKPMIDEKDESKNGIIVGGRGVRSRSDQTDIEVVLYRIV